MPELFAGLTPGVGLSLILALAFVLAFEFINGFHDTANAVATVIYTKAMPAHVAVIASGFFNFLGVMLGGVGVAYAIVHLLPVELLVAVDTGRGLSMVFSMLAAAIVWNLGTWYFGIPASSSHTLIGSILGVGLANAWLTGLHASQGLNWGKVIEVASSLIVSPVIGFVLAGWVLLVFKRWLPEDKMHRTPDLRRQADHKKRPPFWNRLVLVVSAMTVSFVHGSNDGQKGIGLIMLVLIGIVPAQFVLNVHSTPYEVQRTRDAAAHLGDFYARNANTLQRYLTDYRLDAAATPESLQCRPESTMATLDALRQDLQGITSYRQLSPKSRVRVRRYLLCLSDTAQRVAAQASLSEQERADLQRLRQDLSAATEYAPLWVIVAIALALGTGTMVGWRRVVLTVGERIGRQGMTYAQGMSAQITATVAIGLANAFSLPVSTTHVLSSGVAGTMVANGSGLQSGTVKNILLAWTLTLPAAMLMSALLFWLTSTLLG